MNATQDAFAALRYRDFSLVTLNQFCLTLAILIQEIIVAYSLYKITKDPLTLGLIGLAEAIPFIALSLWGGYFADRFNKQTIMKICLFFAIPLPLVLWGLFHAYGLKQIELSTLSWGVYAVIFGLGTIRGFYNPSATSLKPFFNSSGNLCQWCYMDHHRLAKWCDYWPDARWIYAGIFRP